jgi:hypothetical protein
MTQNIHAYVDPMTRRRTILAWSGDIACLILVVAAICAVFLVF